MKKLTKIEIRNMARNIIKTNDIVWRAISAVEEFDIKTLDSLDEDSLYQLAKVVTNMKRENELMAEPEFYGLYFQQFNWFGNKFQKYLNKYEI